MFSSKKRIKFLKGDFTSPILGNVWAGRVAVIDASSAKKFIETDYAVDYTDETAGEEAYEAKLIEQRGGIDPQPATEKEDDGEEDFLEGDDDQDDEESGEDDGLPEGDGTDDQNDGESQESDGEEEKEPEPLTLDAALKALNPHDDAHWTKAGLPDLNVLKELTGAAVKRADVEDAAPDFNREVAHEAKG